MAATMNFGEALWAMKDGKCVARFSEHGQYISYLRIRNNVIEIVFKDRGKPWLPNQTDILANDWIVLSDKLLGKEGSAQDFDPKLHFNL